MKVVQCHYQACRMRVCENKAVKYDGKPFCNLLCVSRHRHEETNASQQILQKTFVPRVIATS